MVRNERRSFFVLLLLAQHGSYFGLYQELVTATRDGFDVDGPVGGISQGVSESLDGMVQALIEVDESSIRPQGALQLSSCDDFSGFSKQYQE